MRSKNKYTIDDCISEMCRWGQKLLSPVALSLKISCRGSRSLNFVTLSRVSEALTRSRVVACREAKNVACISVLTGKKLSFVVSNYNTVHSETKC